MKYIIIASLLSLAAYAAPFAQVQGDNANTGNTPTGQTQQLQQQGQQTGAQTGGATTGTTPNTQTGTGAGIANGQTPAAADLATAVANWMADTSMVSNFLNTGASIQNNVQFKQAATVAFNAEVDELNHKAIIDAANSADPNVIAANSTLATGGAFQDVVDKLQEMSVKGQAAAGNIDLINQNRCVNVLPNIDAYMASTGSSSQAVRPIVCDQTGVAGGVQGTGATQPGQPAGSPAAAFAAAQALAAGTGNGLVQNGAMPTGTTGTTGTPPVNGQQPAAQEITGIAPTNGQQPTAQQGQTQGTIPQQGQTGTQLPQQGTTGTQAPQQGTPQQIQPQGTAGTSGQQIAQNGQNSPVVSSVPQSQTASQQQQTGSQQLQTGGDANSQSPAGAATSTTEEV